MGSTNNHDIYIIPMISIKLKKVDEFVSIFVIAQSYYMCDQECELVKYILVTVISLSDL